MISKLRVSLVFVWLAVAIPAAAAVYPEFTAHYSVKTNGIKTATAVFTLTRDEQGAYLYEQKSQAVGVASIFTSAKSRQSSRWRYRGERIEVSEFTSQRKGGDDDDNASLMFNWDTQRVTNIGAGEQWDIAMPEGTLDVMVMQLAMTLDLQRGETVFEYPVAIRGRIKRFQFAQVAQEKLTLAMGSFDAVKIQRMDDQKDKSWTWSVPELDYFPVRFLKEKKNGLKVDVVLEKLEFKETAPVTPATADSDTVVTD